MVLLPRNCLTQSIALISSKSLAKTLGLTSAKNIQYSHLRHIAHQSPLRSGLEHSIHCETMISSLRDTGAAITKRLSSSVTNGQLLEGSSNKIRLNKNKSSQDSEDQYSRAIRDLNLLQSNTQVLALAKYNTPENIIPLFTKQLELAGVSLDQLDKLNIIHVSGTKGKGSTCAFTESILRASGLKTGFYNSPHLIKVTERIKINGRPIDDELFSKYFRQIYDRLTTKTKREEITMPSYFSFLTILAFHIFIEEKVDCAIVEVGIGGEYDPTNVIRKPVACGITTLDLDHTNILGNTIERIAWTKAGIIKSGAPVFTVEHEQNEALNMIQTRANEKHSKLCICKPMQKPANNFELGIKGPVQFNNASLACQLARHFLAVKFPEKLKPLTKANDSDLKDISTNLDELPESFRDGLTNCDWPGRCQIIEYPPMVFFIDGAHTKKSIINCLDWFNSTSFEMDQDAYRILMVNIIGERDKAEILKPLTRYESFDLVIFSTNRINPAGDTPKSETFVNLQGPNSEKSLENVKSNASIWRSLMKDNNRGGPNLMLKPNTLDSLKSISDLTLKYPTKRLHVLATGSLHFVGAILETLQLVNGLDRV